MSNSHTPGPWSAGLLEEDGPWAVGTENGSVAIAKMIGAPGQHNEANARLMAAAPEMLEALRRLLRCHDGVPMPATEAERRADAARSLIAKIEGR